MSAYDILSARGVTRFCHFTKLQNLTHILASPDGILSSGAIQQDTKHVNDSERYDGELDYVCCTVEYPNSWFLDNAIHRNSDRIFRDWVVLCISLDILHVRNIKFCECNASKHHGSHIRSDVENIDSIFAPSVSTFQYPRTAEMLPCCPTNGQAEVLIQNNIPREYISRIIVGAPDIAERIYAMQKVCNIPEIPIYVAPDVLSNTWNRIVKRGQRPQECKCTWPEEV